MPNKDAAHRITLSILGTTLLGTAAIAGFHAYRDHAARDRVRTVLESRYSIGSIRRLSQSSKAADRLKAAGLQRACDEWFAEVLARNPGLQPEWKQVPDAENGFLQLLTFAERHGDSGEERLGLPEELSSIINGSTDWDHEAAAAALADHQDLIAEITGIGLLPDQSAAKVSIDRYWFIGYRFYKECCDLLLADARVAAESGDTGRTVERVRATLGIAEHLSGIETPSLISETVAILVRLDVDGQVVQHILPTLDLDAGAIAEWGAVLKRRQPQPSDFAQLLRGDAYVAIGGLAIPLLVGNRDELTKKEIPDPDAFLDAVVSGMLDRVARIETATLIDMEDALAPAYLEAPAGLSPGAQEAYDAFQVGAGAWSRGWIRAASINVRTQAALAIMADQEPPVELITGLPFVFDPDTRTLAHPDDPRLDNIDAEPVTIP
jgi:hypothetical protein